MAKQSWLVSFWKKKVAALEAGDYDIESNTITVRVCTPDGDTRKHYSIESETSQGMRGFGGNAHTFRILNGQFAGLNIRSTNAWYQGDIPEDFQNVLPLNAEWLTIAKIKEVLKDPEAKFVVFNQTAHRGQDVLECFDDCTEMMRALYSEEANSTNTNK